MDYVGEEILELLEEMAPFYNRFPAKKFKNLIIEYQPSEKTGYWILAPVMAH